MLLMLLSIANTPYAIACIGWADSLVEELRNAKSCYDLNDKKERANCYEFKRDFVNILDKLIKYTDDTVKNKRNIHERYRDEEYISELDADFYLRRGSDRQTLLKTHTLIPNTFKTLQDLRNALKSGNKNALVAEKTLAGIASYLAEKSADGSFGRLDIQIIDNTQKGQNTPRCR